MTLNGVLSVTFRYFTEFDKHIRTHNGVDLWRNLCTSAYTMSSWRKFTFAISSPDEFLVI